MSRILRDHPAMRLLTFVPRTLPLILAGALVSSSCRAEAPTTNGTSPAATQPASPEPQPNLGSHSHPITTASPRAQELFNQGMTLVFGFNHDEAVKLFQAAASEDPRAPMPHWGIAWALGPNYNLDIDDPRAVQASDAMARARTLAAGATQAERDYIDLMAGRFSADPQADRAALARRYSNGARELMRKYPDDMDAATLYAESLMNLRPWKLWTLDGQPAPDTLEIVSVLETVLRRDPNHVGANHYLIHSTEASPAPERGLASAERLKTLVPAAGHLVHMPAHVLSRTGDYAGAAAANIAGADADRAYKASGGPADGFYLMAYFSHNLHFLADSHMMQGRAADAQKAADELATNLTPHFDMMPMVESMVAMQLSVPLRFDRFTEITNRPAPPDGRPVLKAWWHFARGVAFARTKQVEAATKERADFATTVATVPETALFGGTGLEPARTVLAVAQLVLDARIEEARGQAPQAIAKWTEAVAAGDRLAYDEPPVWFYPLRESLGGALLRANQAPEAERVFRADLARHPRNPRSLFGLKEALVRQQKTDDARWVEKAFAEGWKNADSMLTVDGL
jgi:tetratricopeptide (TPR) repeat protein